MRDSRRNALARIDALGQQQRPFVKASVLLFLHIRENVVIQPLRRNGIDESKISRAY